MYCSLAQVEVGDGAKSEASRQIMVERTGLAARSPRRNEPRTAKRKNWGTL